MKSEKPKVLHHLWGEPMGVWAIRAAMEGGAQKQLAVVGHQAQKVSSEFQTILPQIEIAHQETQNGTGHAVLMAMPQLEDFEGTVMVICGDTPCLTGLTLDQLCLAREERNSPLALATAVVPDPSGYGRIIRDMLGRLQRITEHKDATSEEKQIDEINTGVYAFDAAFLRSSLKALTTDNVQGEYYLTDLIQIAATQLGEDEMLPTLQIPIEEAMGVNDRVQLAEAAQMLRAQILHFWMRNGVTMEDPATTYIDAAVQLEQDTTLGPQVILRGDTHVAAGVRIDSGCVITNTKIAAGATIHPNSICENALVGENATVGPFARLRPGAQLKKEAKVGNFVEIKKAVLGENAKANHLAYIGDADIGAGSNVGAGTITCNYDGFGKSKTTLGENVFIGSNSTLVAPVEIGDHAYVAAGSTINKNVSDNDLAIGRIRQENKSGYAEKLRTRFKNRKNKTQ